MVPEATSFPDSFEYPSEIDVLIDLKIRFPNSKIFYREHPAIHIYGEYGHIHYQGLHKNLKFFQLLRTLNIHLINSKMHISNVRKKNCLFATKTGRVAIENSVLGRSTIVYGFPFYGFNLPGTVHISNLRGDESVSDIKQFSTMKNAKYQICKYLIGRFSGSIANPGIGAPGNDHLGNYNYELQLLSKYLFVQHYR